LIILYLLLNIDTGTIVYYNDYIIDYIININRMKQIIEDKPNSENNNYVKMNSKEKLSTSTLTDSLNYVPKKVKGPTIGECCKNISPIDCFCDKLCSVLSDCCSDYLKCRNANNSNNSNNKLRNTSNNKKKRVPAIRIVNRELDNKYLKSEDTEKIEKIPSTVVMNTITTPTLPDAYYDEVMAESKNKNHTQNHTHIHVQVQNHTQNNNQTHANSHFTHNKTIVS